MAVRESGACGILSALCVSVRNQRPKEEHSARVMLYTYELSISEPKQIRPTDNQQCLFRSLDCIPVVRRHLGHAQHAGARPRHLEGMDRLDSDAKSRKSESRSSR